MSATKTIWEKGDYTRVAASMRESGEALVPTLGIKRGLKVLDLGCGDGTTALPAARLGAEVWGVDTARNLIAAASQRAREEGLANLRFQVGDAIDLSGFRADTFDLVVSIFGAMFADRPFDAAKEWGIEANVIERFASAGISQNHVSLRREIYKFTFPGAPADLMNEFRYHHGETMEAFEAAEKNGCAEDMRKDLCALFERLNISQREGVSSIPAAFLRVTVTVP